MFKSSDAGLTWTLLSTNGLPAAIPMGVAISGSLGAGRFREVPTIYVLMPGFLYSSHDNGASWSRCGRPVSVDGDPLAVDRVAVDPLDGRIVYAVSNNYTRIHKSVDGCKTWSATGTAKIANFPVQFEFSDLTVDPANPRVLYGATYRSTNGGDTFEGPQTGLRQTDRRFTWTAQYRMTSVPPASGVEVSWDAGTTWTPFPVPAGGPIESLYVDLRNSVVYVVRGQKLHRTTDQGASWVAENLPLDVCDAATFCPDGLLTLDPFRPSILYIGSQWKSIDYGHTWTALPSTGMRDHLPDVLSLAAAPSDADTLYASVWFRNFDAAIGSSGVMRSDDGGASWVTWPVLAGTQLRDLTVDAFDDRRVYGIVGQDGAPSRLKRSVDGGESWNVIEPPACGGERKTRFVSAAAAARTLFVAVDGSSCGVVSKSIDGGETWSIVSTRSPGVAQVAADAVDPLLLYMLVEVRTPGGVLTGYSLERSQDGGATFQTLPQVPSRVTIHPTIRGTLFVTRANAIEHSTDAGESWASIPTPVDAFLRASAIAAVPDSPVLYASLESGIYDESTNKIWEYDPRRSESWKNVGLSAFAALAVSRGTTPTLYAGTRFIYLAASATGIWRLRPPTSRIVPVGPTSLPPPGSIVAGGTQSVDAGVNTVASIGVSAPEYRFSRWDPLIGWHVVQDFSAATRFTWTPQPTDAGTHAFQVTIRDVAGSADAAVTTFDRTFTVPSANSIGPVTDLVVRSAPTDLQRILFDNNADGIKDLFVYNRASGEWSIYTGTREGFTNGPSGGWSPGWTISVADFNGDTFDDFFLYSRETGVFYKVINTGAGFSYFSQVWLPGFDVYIVDFNGDRRSDVFIHNPSNGVWYSSISVGDGTQGFTYIGGGWATGWQIARADFDGNGRGDLFLYNRSNGASYKVMTLANGTFDYTPGQAQPGRVPTIMDLNGDGHSDVLFYDAAGGVFERCTSVGDGTAGFDCASGGWLPGFSVYAANFDNDARTDLFLHQASTGTWFKVVNASDGFHYAQGGWAIWNVDVADLDGDRRSDVFLFDPARFDPPRAVFFKALTSWPHAFDYVLGTIR